MSRTATQFSIKSIVALSGLFLLGALFVAMPAKAFDPAALLEQITKGSAKYLPQRGFIPAPVALPQATQGFEACAALFPKNRPLAMANVPAQWNAQPLCFNNFAVLHSTVTKTPLVVIEKLNREQIADAANEQRTDVFFADPRITKNGRAELTDYEGTGFDRGHMAPAADMPDADGMAQSFALSNMVPQDPTNNRKIWAKIESDVRKYVRRAPGNVYVFSGPIFNGQTRTVGRNKVWVPSHLFKLVYDEASGRSWAYVLPNTADARIEAPMDYPTFVQQTGWQLL